MSTILSLAPQNVWKHFYSLTQIPRPSGHMEKITALAIQINQRVFNEWKAKQNEAENKPQE